MKASLLLAFAAYAPTTACGAIDEEPEDPCVGSDAPQLALVEPSRTPGSSPEWEKGHRLSIYAPPSGLAGSLIQVATRGLQTDVDEGTLIVATLVAGGEVVAGSAHRLAPSCDLHGFSAPEGEPPFTGYGEFYLEYDLDGMGYEKLFELAGKEAEVAIMAVDSQGRAATLRHSVVLYYPDAP